MSCPFTLKSEREIPGPKDLRLHSCFTPNLHITSDQQCGSFRQNASLTCVCTDTYRLSFWVQFPFFLKYIILDVSFHKGLSVASSWRFPLLWGRWVLRQFCGHTIIVQQFSLNTGNVTSGFICYAQGWIFLFAYPISICCAFELEDSHFSIVLQNPQATFLFKYCFSVVSSFTLRGLQFNRCWT